MSVDRMTQKALAHLDEETRREVANMPRADMVSYHQSLGVRNSLGMWVFNGWPDRGQPEWNCLPGAEVKSDE